MKVKLLRTVISKDSVDSKFDYKKFLVSGKNKAGRFITREVYENQDVFLTTKSSEVFKTLEDAFMHLT